MTEHKMSRRQVKQEKARLLERAINAGYFNYGDYCDFINGKYRVYSSDENKYYYFSVRQLAKQFDNLEFDTMEEIMMNFCSIWTYIQDKDNKFIGGQENARKTHTTTTSLVLSSLV